MNVAAHPIAPRRPLLELLLRARAGVSRYRAVPLGANQPVDIDPAREANLWIHQNIANHPLMQQYLDTIPPDSRSFAINRAVDYVRDLLYRTSSRGGLAPGGAISRATQTTSLVSLVGLR